jgi:hypothetical protein
MCVLSVFYTGQRLSPLVLALSFRRGPIADAVVLWAQASAGLVPRSLTPTASRSFPLPRGERGGVEQRKERVGRAFWPLSLALFLSLRRRLGPPDGGGYRGRRGEGQALRPVVAPQQALSACAAPGVLR